MIRIVALGIALALLYVGTPIFLTLLSAIFLFMLLDPVVVWAAKRKVGRKIASAVAVSLAMLIVLGTGFAFYLSLLKVANTLPQYSEKIEHIAGRLHAKTNVIQKSTDAILSGPEPRASEEVMKVQVVGARPSISSFLLRGFNSVMGLISMAVFIPLIGFFLLIERDSVAIRLKQVVGERVPFEDCCAEIRAVSRGFFIGNFVIGSSMALCFACVFFFLKLEDALELSLFAGFLNLIPVFGAILGAAIPSIQAGLQYEAIGPMMVILLFSVVIHFVGNNIVLPNLIGRGVNVSGVAAMIGFLFWGTLWGAMGLFLAIPLMATLRIVLNAQPHLRSYANLISRTPPSPRPPFTSKRIRVVS